MASNKGLLFFQAPLLTIVAAVAATKAGRGEKYGSPCRRQAQAREAACLQQSIS